jgi:hypothetical protein
LVVRRGVQSPHGREQQAAQGGAADGQGGGPATGPEHFPAE